MSAPERREARAVLVTGAGGLVGRQVVARLAALSDETGEVEKVVALDVRPVPEGERLPGVVYETRDIRDPALGERFAAHGVETVVHLAAVVTPGPGSSRQLEYEIDVLGTENVLRACVAAGVRRIVYTSSGAAYGYHADAPALLDETAPLRGNPEFAYADHKRRAEEALARYRREHPELAQLVLRPGTILGDTVASPISALFERPVVVGVRGAAVPFVLVWDEDVADCIVKGVLEERAGIYNLTGDGAVPLREIARRLGKPYLPLPAWLLAAVLRGLHAVGLAARGAEQVDFLRHRPVLSNEKLKHELGFVPRHTSSGCLERWRRARFPESLPLAGPPARVAAVTGGAGGIGAALCRRLARAGARVAVLDRDLDGAAAVADELVAEGHEVLALACDVTSPQACQEAIDAVVKRWDGLDVLVANAGITHLGRFADTDVDVIRRVMEVNFFGAVHCTKAALPRLLERRGTVVVLGSVAGLAPLATRTGYAASKHALHGFFESLRAEHLGDLGVLLVDPSFVDTAIGAHALGPDGGAAGPEARTGVDHPIPPEDVAEAVLRALRRRRRHLYVPWRAAAYVWLARLAPAGFARAMARRTAASAPRPSDPPPSDPPRTDVRSST